MKCLMLGCGFAPPARLIVPPGPPLTEPIEWTRLDINPECKPDAVFDLEITNGGGHLPFPPMSFHEIHAYQTMEHFGRQGDFIGLFATMRAFWRVLKPGGLFVGSTPALHSMWLWGDPGHTRVICQGTFVFLTRELYENGLGSTSATDYRRFVDPCWWELLHSADVENDYTFALRKAE